jgi:hypothetical protein
VTRTNEIEVGGLPARTHALSGAVTRCARGHRRASRGCET